MCLSRLELCTFAAKRGWLGAWATLTAVALAGCANETVTHYSHGHEYFSQAEYGRASPKVVADGQPVPRGGGQYLVGRPYRIAGRTYRPAENTSYSAVGMASWYGAAFRGRRTANGEIYDMAALTAAHPTMPLPSYARVTNLSNGYSIIVRVNDRGPYSGGRVMDVSSRVADVLKFKGAGTARIKVQYVGRAPLGGSDDSMLLASLRTDGSPANLNGYSAPVMVASNARPPQSEIPREAAPVRAASRVAPPGPIRVALAESAPASEPEYSREDVPPASIPIRQPRFPVPLPPPRPFDLGAIRNTTVVAAVAPPRPAPTVTPPRRHNVQAIVEKALYFAPAPPVRQLKWRPRGAFDRVKPAKASLNDD